MSSKASLNMPQSYNYNMKVCKELKKSKALWKKNQDRTKTKGKIKIDFPVSSQIWLGSLHKYQIQTQLLQNHHQHSIVYEEKKCDQSHGAKMREYGPGGISQYRIYSYSGQPTMTLATCVCYFKCIHVMVPSNFETRSFYDSFNSMTWLMQSCFI